MKVLVLVEDWEAVADRPKARFASIPKMLDYFMENDHIRKTVEKDNVMHLRIVIDGARFDRNHSCVTGSANIINNEEACHTPTSALHWAHVGGKEDASMIQLFQNKLYEFKNLKNYQYNRKIIDVVVFQVYDAKFRFELFGSMNWNCGEYFTDVCHCEKGEHEVECRLYTQKQFEVMDAKAKKEYEDGGYTSLKDKSFRSWAQKDNHGFLGSPINANAIDVENTYVDTHHLETNIIVTFLQEFKEHIMFIDNENDEACPVVEGFYSLLGMHESISDHRQRLHETASHID